MNDFKKGFIQYGLNNGFIKPITINAEEIGRLYAGDWMFIPWGAHDTDNDIKVTPSVATTMTFEYMLFISA